MKLFTLLSAAGISLNNPAFAHGFRIPSPTAGINKYTPHQGKRECARRVRQMALAAAKKGGAQ